MAKTMKTTLTEGAVSIDSLLKKMTEYRRLISVEDFKKAEQTQKLVWSMNDIDILPSHFMIAMADHGEQWGAFESNELVGLALAYPLSDGKGFLAHMGGVVPSKRNSGVGLKLFKQMGLSLEERGTKYLTLTYDPLDAGNANLYHNGLKAVGHKVIFNYYGELRSGHHGELPSHRLLCRIDLGKTTQDKLISADTKKIKMISTLEELKKLPIGEAIEISNKYFNDIASLIQEGYVVDSFDKTTEGKYLIFNRQ